VTRELDILLERWRRREDRRRRVTVLALLAGAGLLTALVHRGAPLTLTGLCLVGLNTVVLLDVTVRLRFRREAIALARLGFASDERVRRELLRRRLP
jgi:hypothetical protein